MIVLTESEMVRLYRNAMSQRKELRILSEINQISVEKVIEILEKHGIEVNHRKNRRPRKRRKKKWVPDPRTGNNPDAFYTAFEKLIGEQPQAKVSKDMGISEPTISRYLTRKGLPSKGNYNKILSYAKKESEEFLKGELWNRDI